MDRSESVDNACPVCHDNIQIFAVGPCDHPVCYKCSTRMRVLCEQMDCPICRSSMLQVVFVTGKKLFKDLHLRDCIPNRKNKIFYESEEVEDKYLDLLEFRCRFCPQRKPERTFAQLQTHIRREHQLFACDICLAHLKIFPYETKFYDRKFLAVHRRMGDEDDKAYKGHPLCEFCDRRYLDKDELMKHLRKDHFYCHFCDQDCSNAYYNDYADLYEHFKESHFVCTEDDCANPSTRFTHAFSSDIDLKSHKTTVHNRKSKDTRTIDIDFQFAPRHQGYGRGSGINSDDYEDSGTQRHRNRGGYGNRRRQQDDSTLQRAMEASLEESIEAKPKPVPDPINDFPTLGGAPASQIQSVIDSQQKSANASKPVDHFPTLGGNTKGSQNPVRAANMNKNYAAITHVTMDARPAGKEKVKESGPISIGSVKGRNKERWAYQAPDVTEADYPTLVGKGKPSARPASATASNTSTSWLQKSSVAEVPAATNVAPTISVVFEKPSEPEPQLRRSVPVMRPVSDEKEFPSLGGGAARPEPVSANKLWSKQPANNTKTSKNTNPPKAKKVDDETFELPDSYYRSYETAEYQLKAKPKDESHSTKSSKKGATIDKKDFPDLPKKQVENKPSDNVKTQKPIKNDAKKVETKIVDVSGGGKKSKKSKKAAVDKSLNDIAAGLMNISTGVSQGKGGKKDKTDDNAAANGNHAKVQKDVSASTKVSKPDWFDNPIDNNNGNQKNVQSKSKTESRSLKREDNNFPSLHSMSPSVPSRNAPPGFMPSHVGIEKEAAVSVPPGFSKSRPKPAVPPGLSKPTFSVHDYVQPANFLTRNQMLVQSIRFCLETVEDGFDHFKTLSFQFRQGVLSANSYYTNCQLLIGESDFRNIFPELLALLPDINKQQELWFEHQVASCSKTKDGMVKTMSPCSKCGQVILKSDQLHHNLQHGDGADFPSLSNGNRAPGHPTKGVKGAWIKAT